VLERDERHVLYAEDAFAAESGHGDGFLDHAEIGLLVHD
jgi:hypothetical protein